jgi:hypothetical protein
MADPTYFPKPGDSLTEALMDDELITAPSSLQPDGSHLQSGGTSTTTRLVAIDHPELWSLTWHSRSPWLELEPMPMQTD